MLSQSQDTIETARRKALLPGLAIYGKIGAPQEVCPCLLVGNRLRRNAASSQAGCMLHSLEEQEGGMPGAIILIVRHSVWP